MHLLDPLGMQKVPPLRPLSARQAHALQKRSHAPVKIQEADAQFLPDSAHIPSSFGSSATRAVTLFSGSIRPPAVRHTPILRASSHLSSGS